MTKERATILLGYANMNEEDIKEAVGNSESGAGGDRKCFQQFRRNRVVYNITGRIIILR